MLLIQVARSVAPECPIFTPECPIFTRKCPIFTPHRVGGDGDGRRGEIQDFSAFTHSHMPFVSRKTLCVCLPRMADLAS